MLPDANDDMVLETAVNGRADLLVTFNRRHFEAASATFGIDIESPAETVRRLRGLLCGRARGPRGNQTLCDGVQPTESRVLHAHCARGSSLVARGTHQGDPP